MSLFSIFRKVRLCYRCARPAKRAFMALDYCLLCSQVVPMMYPAVRHDPPFGFPGAKGYDPLGPDPYNLKERGK